MTENIRKIILEKKFYSLSEEEQKLLSDYVETEEQFEQLKRIISLKSSQWKMEKPVLSNTTKKKLDMRFNQVYQSNRMVWLNSFWLLIWPENRPFLYRPLVAFASLTLIVLTVTFFPSLDNKQQIAQIMETKDSREKKSELKDAENMEKSEIVKEKVETKMDETNSSMQRNSQEQLEEPINLNQHAIGAPEETFKEEDFMAMDAEVYEMEEAGVSNEEVMMENYFSEEPALRATNRIMTDDMDVMFSAQEDKNAQKAKSLDNMLPIIEPLY